jgi:hypothetical protein
MRDESWDITMYSLAKLIDGACSVKRLASMADIDLPLARECIQHLLWVISAREKFQVIS